MLACVENIFAVPPYIQTIIIQSITVYFLMNRNIFLLSKDKGTLITLNTYITMCSSLAICIYIFSCSDVRLQVVIYLSVKQQVALSLSLFAIPLSPSLSLPLSLSLFSPTFSTSLSPALPFSCSPPLSLSCSIL